MTVRAMEADDRESVIELIRATGMFTAEEEQVAVELIDIYLTQPEQRDYAVDVAEDATGAVAGYICHGPTPMTDGTVDLYWIAVHPARYRQGYGRALVERVEQALRQKGGRLIVIETSSRELYAPTRHFYRSLGYVEQARLRDFYRPGDDRILYGKYL